MIQIIGSNLTKEVWGSDAALFRPERWETVSVNSAANAVPGVWGNQLSFLGGPKGCIGFRFALIEYVHFFVSINIKNLNLTADFTIRMKAILYTLVRAFEFGLAVPADDIIQTQNVVVRPSVRSEPKVGNQMPLLIKPFRL